MAQLKANGKKIPARWLCGFAYLLHCSVYHILLHKQSEFASKHLSKPFYRFRSCQYLNFGTLNALMAYSQISEMCVLEDLESSFTECFVNEQIFLMHI